MPEPVKLSRERWEMLAGSYDPITFAGLTLEMNFIQLTEPRQVGDVVFLPANYHAPDNTSEPPLNLDY